MKMQRESENKSPFEISKIDRSNACIVVLVLAALMIAEAVTSRIGNTPFMFFKSVNRRFEFVLGSIPIVLAASVIESSNRPMHFP